MRAGLVHRALDPMDLGQIDAEFVMQHAVDEDCRRHGVERHADALALEILRRLDAGLLVDGNEAHPECDRREHRKGDERTLVAGKALSEFGQRIFRRIEFLAARHAIEDRARLIDGDEIEIDAVRLDLSGVERLHPVIKARRERKLQLGHGLLILRILAGGRSVSMPLQGPEARRQCSSLRRIFPILLFGSVSRNSISLGIL